MKNYCTITQLLKNIYMTRNHAELGNIKLYKTMKEYKHEPLISEISIIIKIEHWL